MSSRVCWRHLALRAPVQWSRQIRGCTSCLACLSFKTSSSCEASDSLRCGASLVVPPQSSPLSLYLSKKPAISPMNSFSLILCLSPTTKYLSKTPLTSKVSFSNKNGSRVFKANYSVCVHFSSCLVMALTAADRKRLLKIPASWAAPVKTHTHIMISIYGAIYCQA